MDVATNQMRREAAKRKLAGQQARRVARAARRRRIAVISSVSVVVLVLVGVVALSTVGRGGGDTEPAADPAASAAPPARAEPAAGPVTCAYPAEGDAAKANQPPPGENIANDGTVSVALDTSAGPIGLTLDRAQAACTVNSVASLARQGYYDGTVCHRLTTGEGLKVLQCGDPTGTGTGGPGYTIPDEPPTNLAPSPAGGTVTYPRGTLAMAKTAQPNSGGSQFFLVYADSTLPPDYTVFGTVDEAGLATLDAVAAGGSDEANGPGDGTPTPAVEIRTATVA
jgi:peptidyl-prolyl cis-trans isomerase B (cyclophilin B)